jgi:broad specificity phosphatase PhoE
MNETLIILIRHGIRQDFADPSWKFTAQEPNDTPLAEAGLRQAEDIARALEGSGIGAIYCSPFLRALQTAAPASKHLGIPLRIEPGFGEWLNPEWFCSLPRLVSLREAAGICPLVDASYIPIHSQAGLEQDETVEVRARVKIALEAILRRSPGESFAVVAHGSPLGQSATFLVGGLDGVDLRMGAITRISCGNGGFRLISSGSEHLGEGDRHLRFH